MRPRIIAAIEEELGQLPQSHERVPLDIQVIRETKPNGVAGKSIRFETGRGQLEGQLWHPTKTLEESGRGRPGVVTIGSLDPKSAEDLAHRGYVCLAVDVASTEAIDDIWKCMRCVDVLESLPEIDAERIGLVGLGDKAKLAVLFAAVDQRIVATFAAGEYPNWGMTSAYSPAEVVAAVSPRAITLRPFASRTSAEFEAVKQAVEQSQPVFAANRIAQAPTVETIDIGAASFPESTYTWLDEMLLRRNSFLRR